MKLLIDDTIFDAHKIFQQFGDIQTLAGKEISKKDVKNCDILIVRSRTKVDKELLDGSSVRFVGSAVAGLDHIDLDYLQRNNIEFAHAGGCNANAVAEYVIGGIANLAKKYHFDYRNKILGIVGVGNVGSILKEKAEKLGIKVILNDIKNGDFISFEELLKTSDIISFHTPLDESTFNILNINNFHFVKNDCIIFNAARGGIIEECAWIKHSGIKIVDCWENEPDINQELLKMAELATPHIAGHSIDAKFMGSYMIYQQLCDFLRIEKNTHKIEFDHKIKISDNFLTFINQVYDFKTDDKVLRSGNFEDYRRFYPKRFEWHNYKK